MLLVKVAGVGATGFVVRTFMGECLSATSNILGVSKKVVKRVLFFLNRSIPLDFGEQAFQMQKPELKKGSPSSSALPMSAGGDQGERVLEKGWQGHVRAPVTLFLTNPS